MSQIETSFEDGILIIKKKGARKTNNDIEKINISNLVYKQIYRSKIKPGSKENKNSILLIHELKDSINKEEKDVILVYSKLSYIMYEILPKSEAYKKFVKIPYKVLNIGLSKKYLKIRLFAYIVAENKYKIENMRLGIDCNNFKEIKLNRYSKLQSSFKLFLKGGHTYYYKFKIKDLLNSNEEINNSINISVKVNDVDIEYKLGIKDKKIKMQKLDKKYYNLPLKSVYSKEYAIHLRRTIGGNLVLVKRLIEPIEKTFKFKVLESKFLSSIMYHIGKFGAKYRKKKINIFYEKFASKAEEGVYELYTKCKQSKNTYNYFVIDEKSEDYKRICKDKNVIRKYSFKYYWLIYNSSWFIASEAPSHLNILRSNNKYFRKATYDKDFVFLQHGIIYMKNLGINSSFKRGKEGESKYMVVSSEKEREVVSEMLDYSEEQLLKTGLGMYSNINFKHINNESENYVTIMLTWKPYEEQLYNFEESTYYKNVIEISNILKKYIDKKKIIIIAHPKAQSLLINTDLKNSMWNEPISKALEKTKLLITDYSSVCYNTFYQGGGVIFYQPDLEKYELENGELIPNDDEYIGKRVFNIQELEDIIKQTIKDKNIDLSVIRTKQHEDIYKTINEFSDGKNLDRIYEQLVKLNLV